MLDYWESVALNRRHSPYVQRAACQLIKSQSRRININVCRVSAKIWSCNVSHVDNFSNKVVYDASTKVSDIVPYLAWAIGLKRYQSFEIYETRGQELIKLDSNVLLSEAIKAVKFQKHETETKLLMKSPLLKLNEEHLDDPMMIHLMYHQARLEYFRNTTSLSEDIVVTLSTLQIQAGKHINLIQNAFELQKCLSQFIPYEVNSVATILFLFCAFSVAV